MIWHSHFQPYALCNQIQLFQYIYIYIHIYAFTPSIPFTACMQVATNDLKTWNRHDPLCKHDAYVVGYEYIWEWLLWLPLTPDNESPALAAGSLTFYKIRIRSKLLRLNPREALWIQLLNTKVEFPIHPAAAQMSCHTPIRCRIRAEFPQLGNLAISCITSTPSGTHMY